MRGGVVPHLHCGNWLFYYHGNWEKFGIYSKFEKFGHFCEDVRSPEPPGPGELLFRTKKSTFATCYFSAVLHLGWLPTAPFSQGFRSNLPVFRNSEGYAKGAARP